MQIPIQIEPDKATEIERLLGVFSLSLAFLEDNTDQHSRYKRGLFTELVIFELLSCIYPEQVRWDAEKAERQMHNGPDGQPDPGWDIETQGLRIDVKWDSQIQHGNVQLGLYRRNGGKQLLLSGKATTSAQVYLLINKLSPVEKYMNKLQAKRGKKPKPEFGLKILWIDLDKLRSDLVLTNGRYSIAGYAEQELWTGDRTITLPISLIIEKYGRLDTIQS